MMASDTYSIGRSLLEAASEALSGTYAGTPDRRFVGVGMPAHDVPDQLIVYVPSINQSQLVIEDVMYLWSMQYVISITRPYPGQPGDGGAVDAKYLDEAAKIIYEDADALLSYFSCNTKLGARVTSITAVEPLGGVAGWTVSLTVTASS